MKKIYLKPTTTEESEIYSSDIMITASVNGTEIVDNGGNTADNNITEGDSRRQNIWDDGEEEF